MQTWNFKDITLHHEQLCKAEAYARLAKVDASYKLTDNHDVHTLDDLPLEGGGICQVRQHNSWAQVRESSQASPQI